MDETTKVIIATLSGFIIAFLAEPVKDTIRHKNKLRNLRIALYRELISNFSHMQEVHDSKAGAMIFFHWYSKPIIRTECYKYAIEHDISLFYELDEAIAINGLYQESISRVVDYFSYIKTLSERDIQKDLDSIVKELGARCFSYSYFFSAQVRRGIFDKKLIAKLSKELYPEIIGLEQKYIVPK